MPFAGPAESTGAFSGLTATYLAPAGGLDKGSGQPRLRPRPIKKLPLLISNRNAGRVSWTHMMLIKLNDKGVRVYTSSRYRNPSLDWQSRTGRVAKYSPDRAVAYVVWNGRRSFDRVSVDLIEPATSLVPDIADALVGY
jgi:hypothetical protein